MKRKLSILILENPENDMELTICQFKKASYDIGHE